MNTFKDILLAGLAVIIVMLGALFVLFSIARYFGIN